MSSIKLKENVAHLDSNDIEIPSFSTAVPVCTIIYCCQNTIVYLFAYLFTPAITFTIYLFIVFILPINVRSHIDTIAVFSNFR